MTRGNQRELARAKNAKKQGGTKSSDQKGNKGKSLDDRKQRDADIMRLKQEKAAAKSSDQAAGTSKK